jgi:hypothetical protein
MDNPGSVDPWPKLIPSRISSLGGRAAESSFALRLTRTGMLIGVFMVAFVASLAASAFEVRLAPDTYDASRAASLEWVRVECDRRVAFELSPSRSACYSWMAEQIAATKWVPTAATPGGVLRAIAIAALVAGMAWGATWFAVRTRSRRTVTPPSS